MDATQRNNRNWEKFRIVAESGTHALNFYFISKLNWQYGQKGQIVKKNEIFTFMWLNFVF